MFNLLKGKERKEVGDILCDFFKKKLTIDNTKEIEEISKKIFNIFWVSELNRNKKDFFKKYWLEIDMESGIIGVASNLVIDFNHPIHNIKNFNMYKELDLELQEMIKSSVIFCRSDNKIAIGIDEKYKNTINNYFNIKENVESFEHYFINKFLPMYILTASRCYIYIPSERYIDIIMENKEELKEFYIKNNIKNSIFKKVKN
ncbi:TPA: hypothetical protein NV714_000237 [Escherichia coli]|nr:hypothetical protein [Escherichia coli]